MARKRSKTSRNPIISSMISTYIDFSENTSIHGLKYTTQKGVSTSHRLLWLLMVFLGVAGSIFMVGLFWERYTSNPTRTSIKTSYAPTISIPFPAVTICNINRIFESKVKAFVKKLDLYNFDEKYVSQIFPQLLPYTDLGFYNITELEMLQDLLNQNEFDDITRVIYKISQSCKEMLLRCVWEGRVIDCTKYFITVFTPDGLCCSFNYNPSSSGINYTIHSGIRMGLIVLLNPIIEKMQYSSLYSSGMKLIIHHPHSYPGIGNIEKILAIGRQTLFQIDGTRYICSEEVRDLTPEQRECVYNDEHNLRYFSMYTGENCDAECTAKSIFEKCKCRPYFFTFSDGPICNMTKIPCLNQFREEEIEKSDEYCYCPRQCEDVSYDVLSTSTKFVNTEHFSSNILKGVNITENTMILHVYFGTQTQTIILRDTITSTIYLLSSFGGVFSLLLGCSFISGVEIIYYITIRFFVNLSYLNKTTTSSNVDHSEDKKKKMMHSDQIWHGAYYNDNVYTIYGKNVFLN